MSVNMKNLSESDVKKALPNVDLKAALKSALMGLSDGTSKQPNKTIVELQNDKGDCMFFTGVVESLGCFGVKASPYLVDKSAKGENPVTAYTMLVSSETGLPTVMCDATYLTVARTAETTGLAVDLLLNASSAKKVAVIGSGQAALAHLEVQLRDRTWEEVSVFSPSLAASEQKVEAFKRLGHNALEIASSAEDAVSNADLVMLCTSANSPVVNSAALKVGCLVTSISTDAKDAHEIDPKSLQQMDVYCDYRETVALKAGEMSIAKAEIDWSYDSIVADLPELLSQSTTVETEKTRFWRSTGLAIEDIAAAFAIAEA
ncbi:MAG TPA: ornithine cyclodeaminase [Gammaproteobacteria bacterium]|jgi:L-arginine dehydrogenase|nr:ornithine cyclodeaminase [Gammaproteobacteria bacterium]